MSLRRKIQSESPGSIDYFCIIFKLFIIYSVRNQFEVPTSTAVSKSRLAGMLPQSSIYIYYKNNVLEKRKFPSFDSEKTSELLKGKKSESAFDRLGAQCGNVRFYFEVRISIFFPPFRQTSNACCQLQNGFYI